MSDEKKEPEHALQAEGTPSEGDMRRLRFIQGCLDMSVNAATQYTGFVIAACGVLMDDGSGRVAHTARMSAVPERVAVGLLRAIILELRPEGFRALAEVMASDPLFAKHRGELEPTPAASATSKYGPN